jgi:putative CocE/NonD family hydrolase
VFVMGRNQWREADDWPLPEAAVRAMWLHSGGAANGLDGDGLLSFEPPAGSEPPDTFVFDPLDPVPSMGGPTLSQIAGLPGWNAGPYDQREVEMRRDVLCYTSAPLDASLEVIGPIELELSAASSALDTDFTAKLVDVWPNGRAENLTDGIIRARYRDSLEEPGPLVPGEVTAFRIEVGPTANLFLPGHRIRLEVSSSNFPRFDPNTNTGGDTALEGPDAFVRATNRVFHERARPSRLLLPIIRSAPGS